MNKPIASLMARRVVVADVDDSIEKVESVLDAKRLSCLPVADIDGTCFGVISASDLMHFHGRGRNPKTVRAWEVCTHGVIEVSPTTSVAVAARTMVEHGIHHLVVTEGGIILGLVSSIDLVREYLLNQMA